MTVDDDLAWADDGDEDEDEDDPDRADEVHHLLALVGPDRRLAAAALLDLPGNTLVVRDVSAGSLFVSLAAHVVTAEQVLGALRARGLVRPGIAGTE